LLAYPLALAVWWVLPWAVSLLAPRYGWTPGAPSAWNLLGMMAVLPGTAGLLWGVREHAAQSTRGIEMKPDKSYLLQRGLYKWSRHPMYVSELLILLGWVVYFGSAAVLILLLVWGIWFNFYAMPSEEKMLERHFGDAYREYKGSVRRWLGRRRG
jgi:protein-S-isoprenylcysteine O-methyltransferase Ste14